MLQQLQNISNLWYKLYVGCQMKATFCFFKDVLVGSKRDIGSGVTIILDAFSKTLHI